MSRRAVVITGATKGLGRATALAFAKTGYWVLGLYAINEVAAEATRAELQAAGGAGCLLKHDVSREAVEIWNRPEIQQAESLVLINNAAAPFLPQPFHLVGWEDFESGLRVGLKGTWLCTRALLRPLLRAGHGTIVNVLSAATRGLPPKGFAAYAATKHAVRGLTLALAAEYAGQGLRVFSVSPGFMATNFTANWDSRLIEAIQRRTPATDPSVAAGRILTLVEDLSVPGQGEDYPL
jgi:3-oxoacyl-[acyl-carrier protein] reductase